MYSAFFEKLGFKLGLVDFKQQTFNKKGIKKAIKEIVEANKEKYPHLSPNIHKLSFDGQVKFAKSYLTMIRNLDLTKVE